jgi:hypothetical protein
MLSPSVVIAVSFVYLLLFLVASWGDRRAAQGRSVVGIVPYIALQLKGIASAYAVMTTPLGGTPLASGWLHHCVWRAPCGQHRVGLHQSHRL